MKNSSSTNSQDAPASAGATEQKIRPWQRLNGKRIAYLTLPLLVMASLVEVVILATGYKYQKTVCVPSGMGVTFFGIGPIGATILAVEMLKLPLAVWTASRTGWQKGFMLFAGLPLICLLTFQLVKDMAVYEMGVAMTPATQMLEKAAAEEVKITHLNGELAAIEAKKVDREKKLAELAALEAKAKTDLEEALKHNETARQDAITLTEYQKKELSEVEARQATIIKQADADAAQLTKLIADLRARRETEVGRATEWNAEEARIENEYKTKLAEYTNKKAAYDKDKAEYDNANFLRRQLMKEPVHPGVPPERAANKVLKPTLVAELDDQIKAKEAELAAVNSRRRDSVAQVAADARRLREEFDRRSTTRRDESDKKREELLAANAALAGQWKTEREQIDQELATAVQKVDGIRGEMDACRKKAEGYYEAREAAIRNTQVHRIATTVEIVRGLLMGERPVSITATAKERGDILTDQISMVRIWVYPVLAFLVAFLPMLMVEIGCSTIYQPEQQRPPHRLGFFGRRMHELYTRAGRLKVLRAERLAKEAAAEVAIRNRALDAAKAAADKALAEREVELKDARDFIAATETAHQDELRRKEAEHAEQLKKREEEWVAKLAGMADSLNRTVVEKDTLRDLQKSEIERQIQMRQNAWSDRITQMRQELDDQRDAAEAERAALIQEHHRKLMEVTEDCKTQVAQARRQVADAELAVVENCAKLEHDLKEAVNARDEAVSQLKQQTETLSLKLAQAREDAARELEKAARQEKHRLELQQLEFAKTLREREEEFDRQLKQREQERTLAFEARLLEERNKTDQSSRRRVAELERQLETRAAEVDARWKHEFQQVEEAAQIRLKQQEQQLKAQAEVRLRDVQTQADQELRRQKLEVERLLDTQAREAESRLREELQQRELAHLAKLKQREQELANKAAAREAELRDQWEADLRVREEEWAQQTESRIRAAEARLSHEVQHRADTSQAKLRQREQELQSQFDARLEELKAQWEENLREREQEWQRSTEAGARAAESRLQAELQQREELFQSKARQRDQQWQARVDNLRADLQAQSEQELRRRDAEFAEARQREQDLVAKLVVQAESHQASEKQWATELEMARAAIEPLKAQLSRAEREREEARHSAAESARHVQELKNKLIEVSSLLNGWKNGRQLVGSLS